jgi:hypothetical protein
MPHLEGVAAPEATNNAGAQTSFIPMLTLGIPLNPVWGTSHQPAFRQKREEALMK